jgi:hypothetical protein
MLYMAASALRELRAHKARLEENAVRALPS